MVSLKLLAIVPLLAGVALTVPVTDPSVPADESYIWPAGGKLKGRETASGADESYIWPAGAKLKGRETASGADESYIWPAGRK
ncbi:hypothetical protein GQ53DRAFT_822424 [Thozetella sp. PMI_491]|nr:hypothetical protein GQ53DRAFT_822424 [Thozetella sp. PMI_491]